LRAHHPQPVSLDGFVWSLNLHAAITTVNDTFMADFRSGNPFRPAQQKDNDSDLLNFDDTENKFLFPQITEGGTKTRLLVGIDFGTTYSIPHPDIHNAAHTH
jgi:hypothetical protein